MTVVMILRVYAMWNKSRRILAILLFIYVPEIMVSIIWECVYNNPDGDLSGMFRAQLEVPRQCKVIAFLSSNGRPIFELQKLRLLVQRSTLADI